MDRAEARERLLDRHYEARSMSERAQMACSAHFVREWVTGHLEVARIGRVIVQNLLVVRVRLCYDLVMSDEAVSTSKAHAPGRKCESHEMWALGTNARSTYRRRQIGP